MSIHVHLRSTSCEPDCPQCNSPENKAALDYCKRYGEGVEAARAARDTGEMPSSTDPAFLCGVSEAVRSFGAAERQAAILTRRDETAEESFNRLRRVTGTAARIFWQENKWILIGMWALAGIGALTHLAGLF